MSLVVQVASRQRQIASGVGMAADDLSSKVMGEILALNGAFYKDRRLREGKQKVKLGSVP